MPFRQSIRMITVAVVILFALSSVTGILNEFKELNQTTRGTPTEVEKPLEVMYEGQAEELWDGFGWNVSYIGDINDDGYQDIGVGAPFKDGENPNDGAVYIFLGGQPGRENISAEFADIVITGKDAELFGWDLDLAGDVNGDDIDDLIVGAPAGANFYGRAYVFFGGSGIDPGNTTNASRTYTGEVANGLLGYSVTGCGDLNNDGYDDIAAGVPGAQEVMIQKGYEYVPPVYVELWDDNATNTPNIVCFETEVNNTASDTNTFGFDAGDDGWDWASDVYAASVGTDADYIYAADEAGGPDADGLTVDGSETIQALVGCDGANPGPTGNIIYVDSCAWGIQFEINASHYALISSGFNALVHFDYLVFDPARYANDWGSREPSYIKSRFTNDTQSYYLGRNIGGDPENEVFYHETTAWARGGFTPVYSSFVSDVSRYINGTDHYYWDLGVWFEHDIGWKSAYAGITAFFDNISLSIEKYTPPMYISGTDGFGWDVDGGMDFNGDGRADLAVSDPFTERGSIYVFQGKDDLDWVSQNNASGILSGGSVESGAGHSISFVKDMNGDSRDELIAGAMASDSAFLYYGKTFSAPLLSSIAPWDDNVSATPNAVNFETEVNNTDLDLNTFGIYPNPNHSDDGWDWKEDVYGNTTGNAATFHSPTEPGGADTGSATPDGSRRIATQFSFVQNMQIESAAWGVQFNISSAVHDTISNGGIALLQFQYQIIDGAWGTEEPSYIKARGGYSNDTMTYIGTNLDGGQFTMTGGTAIQFSDPEPEIWHYRNPTGFLGGGAIPAIRDTALVDMTRLINDTGPFYLDIGTKMMAGDQTFDQEGFTTFFNNISIILFENPNLPDVTFKGVPTEDFGHSVSGSGDISGDGIPDILIGAPFGNNTAGDLAGAVYVFFGGDDLARTVLAEDAESITYGKNGSARMGQSVAGKGSFDDEPLDDPLVGCPAYPDDLGNWQGRAYVLNIPPLPQVSVLYPNGGEVLNQTITMNGTAFDPNGDLDLIKGVCFWLNPDGSSEWILADVSNAPDSGDIFQITFNTTSLPDGDYWLKINATDQQLNYGEDLSDGPFTIDNIWYPVINITEPNDVEGVNTSTMVKARAWDIDGSLNYTRGVDFYYSRDNGTTDPWTWINRDSSPVSGENFSITWDISELQDGHWYLKAEVEDDEGLVSEAYERFLVQNPLLPPQVEITEPWNTSRELRGDVDMNARVYDPNGEVSPENITFYYSKEGAQWVEIGSPGSRNPLGKDFGLVWDSTKVDDGLYRFRVVAIDNSSLSGEDVSPQFIVHNRLSNPPIVHVTYPNERIEFTKAGIITIKAYVVDLENDISEQGALFYFSSDKTDWQLIGSDTVGSSGIYTIPFDTNNIPDGEYWIKVEAEDLDENLGSDISNTSFIVHNRLDNPPVVRVIYPDGGITLKGTVNVTASAFDLEDNIDTKGVAFSYSSNNGRTWTEIGSSNTPVGNVYHVIWDTTVVDDGSEFLINASATDITKKTGFDHSNTTFIIKNREFSPPSIRFESPKAGATVSGIVNITAWAFDLDGDITSKGVTFYYKTFGNDTWMDIGSTNDRAGNEYTLRWDTNTSSTPNGDYLLKASVSDSKGAIAEDSLEGSITIKNEIDPGPGPAGPKPPVVLIEAPGDRAVVSGLVQITVQVTDEDGDLDKVDLAYAAKGGTRIPISTMLPREDNRYVKSWDTLEGSIPDGEYYLFATARDEAGNIVEEQIEVTVDNTADPPGPDDDDDDDDAGMLMWLLPIGFLILLVLLLIVLWVIIMKRKKVEIQIGRFELLGKIPEGRVVLKIDGHEFSGGVDPNGIAHIPEVDRRHLGEDADVECEFGMNTFKFKVTLEEKVIIPPPKGWDKSVLKQPSKPKVEPRGVAVAITQEEIIEGPMLEQPIEPLAPQLPESEEKMGSMRALPPAEDVETWDASSDAQDIEQIEELMELPEDEIDLDEGFDDEPDELRELDEDSIDIDDEPDMDIEMD